MSYAACLSVCQLAEALQERHRYCVANGVYCVSKPRLNCHNWTVVLATADGSTVRQVFSHTSGNVQN